MVSFNSAEWAGKGVKYWFKYCYRNNPEVLISVPFYLVVFPTLIFIYKTSIENYHFKNSRFVQQYVVLRPDDPKVRNVLKFDSSGKRIFLEPKEKFTV